MSRTTHLLRTMIVVLLVLTASLRPSRADEKTEDRVARVATQSLLPFVAAGELSLLSSGEDGSKRALRGAGALLTAGAVELLLKRTVREKRPDSEERTGFPSGHALASFTMATMVSHYQPERSGLAYAAATLISASRVELRRHYWHQVIAGAGLGYVIAKQFAGDKPNKNTSAQQGSFLSQRDFTGRALADSPYIANAGNPSLASPAYSFNLTGATVPLNERQQLFLSPQGLGWQMQW